MSTSNPSKATALILFMLGVCPGCGGRASGPVDEVAARGVLNQALDAWAAGKRADDMRTQAPEVIVVDQQWTDGARLVNYEILRSGSFDGKTLRAPVNLTVVEPRARTPQKVGAKFTVGLQPVITVVRVME
jgi:hypothetical protein